MIFGLPGNIFHRSAGGGCLLGFIDGLTLKLIITSVAIGGCRQNSAESSIPKFSSAR